VTDHRHLYSPERPTALVLSGTGADGAYQAGVLRALHEAGVKIDLAAGRGVGAATAVFAAVDGGARLWEAQGVWRGPRAARLYRWAWSLRIVGWSLAASAVVLVSPLLFLAVAIVVYPAGALLGMAGLDAGASLVGGYADLLGAAFAPERLPTWIPRLVTVLAGAALLALVAGIVWTRWRTPIRRRAAGSRAWRLMGAPVNAGPAAAEFTRAIWDLLRGGTAIAAPKPEDLSQRYCELLLENLGQPGFKEILLVVHDLDARRDMVFALLGATAHRDVLPGPGAPAARRAEAFDLGAGARAHLLDVVAGALTVPGACDPRLLRFGADSYWRGETHRMSDRPASLARVLEEVAAAGVEQVILVTASSEPPGPHELRRPRLDGLGRFGEQIAADEAAAVRDAERIAARLFQGVYTVRPAHNPIGPFDLSGAYDERSDRHQGLDELMERGYEDAHRLFVEPVLGASGDRISEERGGGEARWGSTPI
jgi:hypothetical protein